MDLAWYLLNFILALSCDNTQIDQKYNQVVL